MRELRVVGFAQLHNELSSGHLLRWAHHMRDMDDVYVFDQASTDGSRAFYEAHGYKTVLSPTNRFNEELLCKQELLNRVLEDAQPDWIFWIDGDTAPLNFDPRALAEEHHRSDVDGVSVGHYNLWRSVEAYRIDNKYHNMHKRGRVCLWRYSKSLRFKNHVGLHQKQYPQGFRCVKRHDTAALVHYGFSTDHDILNRYYRYRLLGQQGKQLERLVDESTLELRHLHTHAPYVPALRPLREML